MTKTLNALSAAALAVACTLVQAQEISEYTPEELGQAASGAAAAPADVQRIEIRAGSPALRSALVALQMGVLDTRYEMANGRTMLVSAFGDSMRVRYGRRGPMTLVHDGAGTFVSGNGQVSLRFELDGSGEANTAHLSIPAVWP